MSWPAWLSGPRYSSRGPRDRTSRESCSAVGVKQPSNCFEVELKPFFEHAGVHQVSIVDDRSRIAVGEIVVVDGGNRDIQLNGADAGPKYSFGNAAIDDALNESKKSRILSLDHF